MTNATDSSTDNTATDTASKPEIPEKWEHVDPALVPLFEVTREWFEHIYEQFYFSSGGVGNLSRLSPQGAGFSKYHRVHPGDEEFYQELRDRYATNNTIEDAVVVDDYEEAVGVGNRATWISSGDSNDFWKYEYVPFDEEVTTTDGLEAELHEIMDQTPDFEDLFSESRTVANDMFDLDDA